MKKLADISSFERLQDNSNADRISNLSVFNGILTEGVVHDVAMGIGGKKWDSEESDPDSPWSPENITEEEWIEMFADSIVDRFRREFSGKRESFSMMELIFNVGREITDAFDAVEENEQITLPNRKELKHLIFDSFMEKAFGYKG